MKGLIEMVKSRATASRERVLLVLLAVLLAAIGALVSGFVTFLAGAHPVVALVIGGAAFGAVNRLVRRMLKDLGLL
ncbi:hypothetical protein GCM10023192_35200 [Amycolatopsis samaneae]